MPYLAGYVTPQDYGAVGDGVTDDTAAIQSAVNALSAGAKLAVPPTANGYLLNSSAVTIGNVATIIEGQGAENTRFIIGPSFSGTAAFIISNYNVQIRDVSIVGQSSTTTSNPVADAIIINGQRRAKITRCYFNNINGWCIEARATTTNSSSNPLGTQISQSYAANCAGGIHFLGNTTQNWAMNSQVSDFQFYTGGVTTGASANLDGIRIEDAWDVLLENTICWMSVGTGSSLHVKGNCAATFVTNLDTLGPNTGSCVLIEDSTNGSVQNCQITGGVIQQGLTGLTISGGSNNVHVSTVRFISNQTHGVTVSSTASPIHLSNCSFNLNGAGASGTNYDVNWSGTAKGHLVDCWFGTNIVSTGTAGVQNSVNVTAAQAVTAENVVFAGTGASSSNWFTATPAAVLETGSGFDFVTGGTFKGNIAAQPSASGNTVFSANVSGTQSFDPFRILGSGQIAIGSGAAARDAFFGRAGTSTTYGEPNFLVGSQTALGDNGVGELQVANVTTAPTTNPTGGAVLYAVNGGVLSRDPAGNLRSLVTPPPTFASTPGAVAETVSRYLVTTSAQPVSGTLYIQQIYLPAGSPVGHIGFATGATAASGPTHWWTALLDSSYKQQAHSADQTTAAIAASTWFNLAMAASYTATYSGVFYLAFVVVTSTTQPSILQCGTTPAAQFITGTSAPTPLMNGASTASLTTPGTDGTTTYAAPSAASAPFYLYCS